MKKGFIVIETFDRTVTLHYAKNWDDAMKFIATKSSEFIIEKGCVDCFDNEGGEAWGSDMYGIPWSYKIQCMEYIAII